jgi:hypothetical protein
MNRNQRRKAKATARKPLGRPGVPIVACNIAVTLMTPDGPKAVFYWFASEDPDPSMTAEEVLATQEIHGPFDTQAEADADARIAIVGENCVVKKCGMWDSAWDKPQ